MPEDKDLVQKYTFANDRPNCDLCFANIYGWQPLYDTKMAEWKGWLIFTFNTHRHPAFMIPLNAGEPQCTIEEVKDELQRAASPHPFLMFGLTQEEASHYEHEHCERDYDDYIYNRTELETLAGKHLQGKRNHAHRFETMYPQARTCPLQHIDACLQLAEKWQLVDEMEMMKRVLPVRDQLDISGLELWVDDKLVAFTFGAPINENCFDVMVEKADRDYEGAYAVINREFVKSLPKNFTLINREEDLGSEGLRSAKMSYHPMMLLEKYNVWHR